MCTNNEANLVNKKPNSTSVALQNKDSISFIYGDQIIGFVNLIKKNESGKYFFNDIMQQKLFVFDENQKLYSTIGTKGSGPQEFDQILSFTTIGDTVIVYDQALDKFKLFYETGEFIESIEGITGNKILAPTFDLYAYGKSIIIPVINSGYSRTPWNSELFATLSLEGRLKETFGKYSIDLKETNFFDYTPITEIDKLSNIYYVTYTSKYIIDVFNNSGELLTTIPVESDNLKTPDKKLNPTTNRAKTLEQLRMISTPRDLFVTKDFILYYFSNTNEGKDDLYLMVYDKISLEQLGELKIDYPPRLATQENNTIMFEKARNTEGSLRYYIYDVKKKN